MTVNQKLQKLYSGILKIKETPKKLAFGFAMGIFIGMTPFFGLHMAISLLLSLAFKYNKIAALVGVQITNIFTAPFLYGLTYWVGAKTTGYQFLSTFQLDFSFDTIFNLAFSAPSILWSLIIGGLIVGLPMSVFSYFAAYHLYRRHLRLMRSKIKVNLKTIKENA